MKLFALVASRCLLLLAAFPSAYAQPTIQSAEPAVPAHQAPVTAPITMPRDPAELIALARKMNGLSQVGAAPWHLEATYKVIDGTSTVKESGTFEEFWISDKKYKVIYDSPNFKQTDYSNEKGLFRLGNPEWPDADIVIARQSLNSNLPADDAMKKAKLKLTDEVVGDVPMKCVTGSFTGSAGQLYCFSSLAPILRLTALPNGMEKLYDRVLGFRGAYVPGDARTIWKGRPTVQIHIDEAGFAPPPGALEIPRRISLPPGVTTGWLIKRPQPVYPVEAKYKGIQGTVLVHAIIGKDGKVVDATPLSGPAELIKPSVDAVRQSVYRPYLLDGDVVEVEATVNVIFSLRR